MYKFNMGMRDMHDTIFTWLNVMAFITLLRKIDKPTIQVQPLLNTWRQCSYP